MACGKQIPAGIHELIIKKFNSKESYGKIATDLKVPITTIRSVIQNNKKRKNVVSQKIHCGRISKVTNRQISVLASLIKNGHRSTLKNLAAEWSQAIGMTVGFELTRHHLRKLGYSLYKDRQTNNYSDIRPDNKINLKTCAEIIEAFQYFRSYPPIQKIFQCSTTLIKCILSNQEAIIKDYQEQMETSEEKLLNEKYIKNEILNDSKKTFDSDEDSQDSNTGSKIENDCHNNLSESFTHAEDLSDFFAETNKKVDKKTKPSPQDFIENCNDSMQTTVANSQDIRDNIKTVNNCDQDQAQDHCKTFTHATHLLASKVGKFKDNNVDNALNSDPSKGVEKHIEPLTLDLEKRVTILKTYDFNMKRQKVHFNKKKLANMFKCSLQDIELILLNRDSILKEFKNLSQNYTIKNNELENQKLLKKVNAGIKKIKPQKQVVKLIKMEHKITEAIANYDRQIVNNLKESKEKLGKTELELAETRTKLNLTADNAICTNYEDVLKQLEHVEEYAMLKNKYSAITILMPLQHYIQNKIKRKKPKIKRKNKVLIS